MDSGLFFPSSSLLAFSGEGSYAPALCHPFGTVPEALIRPVKDELASLRFTMSQIRTEIAVKQGRPQPLRNGSCRYVAFDEVERVMVLELQAYASYYRGLKELAFRGKVTTVPAALTEEAAKLLGNVAIAYCRVQSAHSFVNRASAVTKWMTAKEFLRCYYEATYAME